MALSRELAESTCCPLSWRSDQGFFLYLWLEVGLDTHVHLDLCSDLSGSLSCYRIDRLVHHSTSMPPRSSKFNHTLC